METGTSAGAVLCEQPAVGDNHKIAMLAEEKRAAHIAFLHMTRLAENGHASNTCTLAMLNVFRFQVPTQRHIF